MHREPADTAPQGSNQPCPSSTKSHVVTTLLPAARQSLAGHAAGTDTPLERKGHRHASLFHDAWPVTSAMTWRDRDKR
ncbi:regulator of G-protein signaling 8 isoform D [Patagioenas fasciata monilis]|uniref:Regulator of G-protein signaling 8 isoform D n=1 Tax=Patagioenas fasciata monilis TaxID=372326 RepID=A0A1V4JXM9_PATFA|nr:regulator of G-protein signaling 8 isoform D [Patagioenas fasciata monilis]